MATNSCKKCGIGILCETDNLKKIIHYLDKDRNYLCNKACGVTESKATRWISKVTCKICMRALSGMRQ